ncbi:hypothetical protein GCM10027053_45400 [Intrasporangium mesophilum]
MGGPRVVILGGGMAGLSAAWELSSGDWRNRVESITVYQRGWRLGGKGASSRGPNDRIEEHGLHVLLGYYDATFRVLREVYAELDRPAMDPASPIRTWREAVAPTGDVGLADHDGLGWSHYVTSFSENAALPGEPGAEDRPLRPFDLASRALQLLADFHRGVAGPPARPQVFLSASPVPPPSGTDAEALVRGAALTAVAAILTGLERASKLTQGVGLGSVAAGRLTRLLHDWRDGIRRTVLADPAMRRTWQLVDLVVTNLQGMVADGLLSGTGYDAIDHLDYREWLARHGAAPETLDSAIVRGMYDLTFAYEGGDRKRPRFAAGLGLQLAGRMLFDYKGSIFWHMQAGMGEVVFAPMYEALRRRGVEFRFFRRLDRMTLGPDRTVGSVTLTRQADLRPGLDRYEPLVRVGGLQCWPDGPLLDQLDGVPGDGCDELGHGLESHWGPADGTGTETLTAGADFDVAVLAVSLGMVPHVAADLVAADSRWRAMVDGVATVATHAAQLWFGASEHDLGWQGPAGVTLTGFGDRFDTWASMSHLLPREGWPSAGPTSLAYLCGAMPDAPPAAGRSLVRDHLVRFLDDEAGDLWPGAATAAGFRWDLLWDGSGRTGRARLDGQYYRANLDPSDRYVQSLPGSGRHRLPPDGSGFANLALAGDWTACGLDAGCVEAATRSGVQAARAILSGALSRPATDKAAS